MCTGRFERTAPAADDILLGIVANDREWHDTRIGCRAANGVGTEVDTVAAKPDQCQCKTRPARAITPCGS